MVETTHSFCKPPIARIWLQCPLTLEITIPHIWTTDRFFGKTVITTTYDLHVEKSTMCELQRLQSCGQSMTTVALLICYRLPLCHLLLLLCFLHQVTQPMSSIPAAVTNLSNLLHDSLESPGLLWVNISEKNECCTTTYALTFGHCCSNLWLAHIEVKKTWSELFDRYLIIKVNYFSCWVRITCTRDSVTYSNSFFLLSLRTVLKRLDIFALFALLFWQMQSMNGKAGPPIRKWIEHPWPNHNNVNQSIVIIITQTNQS